VCELCLASENECGHFFHLKDLASTLYKVWKLSKTEQRKMREREFYALVGGREKSALLGKNSYYYDPSNKGFNYFDVIDTHLVCVHSLYKHVTRLVLLIS